jgi:hypothetical protein
MSASNGVVDFTFMEIVEEGGERRSPYSLLSHHWLLDLNQCLTELFTPSNGTASPGKKKKVGEIVPLLYSRVL